MEMDFVNSPEHKLLLKAYAALFDLANHMRKTGIGEHPSMFDARASLTQVENFIRMEYKLDHLPKKTKQGERA